MKTIFHCNIPPVEIKIFISMNRRGSIKKKEINRPACHVVENRIKLG
jgi:hypothetical protein